MLSVVIVTKNEQERIKACLESVKWADEIIILDNGSDDKTLEISKKYTDRIFKYDNLDFASIRNKGMEQAKGDWVLFVDSDERVTADLKDEILVNIVQEKFSAFAISRNNIIFGQKVSYGPFWPDWVIRLLKKDQFQGWVGKVHEYPKFKGELGYCNSSFIHLTHRNVDQIVLKSLEWSKIDAHLRLEANHPQMSGIRFIRILLSEIFYQGIIRRGFFAGTVGVMDCILQSFSLFITYVRLWQLQQPKDLTEVYDEIDEELIRNGFQKLK